MVGVARRGVAGDLAVDLPRAAPLGVLQVLHQQDRAALARDVAAGAGVERAVRAGGVVLGAQVAVLHLADERVGADRPLRAAADDHVDAAAPDGAAPGVGQGVEAPRPLGDDDAARALHPVLDRDLAGGGRIEPGDGLIGADEDRPLAPEALDLLLAELVAARGAGGDDPHAVLVVHRLGVEAGVLHRHLGGGQAHPGPAVGLHDQALLDVVAGLEPLDLAGDLRGVLGRVEALDPLEPAPALLRRLPVGLGADAVGRDHADAGDDCAAAHDINSFGRAKIMADWKPPNPLPVERATSTCFCRATFGV